MREYLKLLRSVADGKVFDRISVVGKTLCGCPVEQRSFRSRMEIFRVNRPISTMVQGGTLRVADEERFQLVWTADNWATTNRTDSKELGHPGSFRGHHGRGGADGKHRVYDVLAGRQPVGWDAIRRSASIPEPPKQEIAGGETESVSPARSNVCILRMPGRI